MIVKLKDGNVLGGSLWEWRPRDGWFTLTDDGNVNGGDPVRVELSDVDNAFDVERTHVPPTRGVSDCEKCGRAPGFCEGTSRVDVLRRARAEGWDGR